MFFSVNPAASRCFLDQRTFGNLELFRLGVAVQPQYLHAILQAARYGVDDIGRSDEEHLGQIVLHVQVVIHEHVVLFRIEHFQQRRRGIAAEIHRHLLDLIQHEHRIFVPAFFIIWMIWPGKAPM